MQEHHSHPILPRLSEEYMKFLRALTGKTKKCLVVDLDNTLWGGVWRGRNSRYQTRSEYPCISILPGGDTKAL
jgi:hypothetical protein